MPPPPGSRDASAAAPSGLAVEGPRWSAMTVDRRGPSFASGLSPPCGSIGSRRSFLACARRGGRLSDFNLNGILVGGFDETACVEVCAAPRMPPHGTPRQPAAAREAAGALAQRAGVPPTLAAHRQRRQRRARQRSRRACHARGWVGCACAMHCADRWARCSCCAGTAGTARRRWPTASAAGRLDDRVRATGSERASAFLL